MASEHEGIHILCPLCKRCVMCADGCKGHRENDPAAFTSTNDQGE